jgi:hypothetical protein
MNSNIAWLALHLYTGEWMQTSPPQLQFSKLNNYVVSMKSKSKVVLHTNSGYHAQTIVDKVISTTKARAFTACPKDKAQTLHRAHNYVHRIVL